LQSTVRCSELVDQAKENRCFRVFVRDEKAHSEDEAKVCLKAQEKGERYANQH